MKSWMRYVLAVLMLVGGLAVLTAIGWRVGQTDTSIPVPLYPFVGAIITLLGGLVVFVCTYGLYHVVRGVAGWLNEKFPERADDDTIEMPLGHGAVMRVPRRRIVLDEKTLLVRPPIPELGELKNDLEEK